MSLRKSKRHHKDQTDPRDVALYYVLEGKDPPGLIKCWMNDFIGFGVFCTVEFKKSAFICEYPGTLMSAERGRELEKSYPQTYGSYLFFYEKYCIDGTFDDRFGKFINHSSKHPNCVVKPLVADKKISLCLFALRDLPEGTELRYNYGVTGLPWQKKFATDKPWHLSELYSTQDESSRSINEKHKKKYVKASEVLSVMKETFIATNPYKVCDPINTASASNSILSGDDLQVKVCKNTKIRSESGEIWTKEAPVEVSNDYTNMTMVSGELLTAGEVPVEVGDVNETTACGELLTAGEVPVEVGDVNETTASGELLTAGEVPVEDFEIIETSVESDKMLATGAAPVEAFLTLVAGSPAYSNVDHIFEIIRNLHDDSLDRESLSENVIYGVDNFLMTYNLESFRHFIDLVSPLLFQIPYGVIRNWRHDVFMGKSIFVDGQKLTSHDLLELSFGTGGITESMDELIHEKTDQMFQHNPEYYFKVTIPTLRLWVLVALTGLTLKQAKFYIANGGIKTGDQFLKKLEKKLKRKAAVTTAHCEGSMQNDSSYESVLRENALLKKRVAELEKGQNSDRSPTTDSNRKICPVSSCSSTVVNLSRHLTEVHHWPKSRAKCAVNAFGLRKPASRKEKLQETVSDGKKKYKNYHKMRKCPVLGCFSRNMRMSLHLQEVHQIEKGTPYYYNMLKMSQPCQILNLKGNEVTMLDSNEINDEALEVESEMDEEDDHADNFSKLLDAFEAYKLSVDGGKSSTKTAVQSKQELRDIMIALESQNLCDLVKKYKIRDVFLAEYAEKKKGYKALTIKRYLLSLIHFYDFLLTEEVKLPLITPEDILRMKVTVARWSKSYNGTVQIQQLSRQMEEQSILITPSQIQKYEVSESAREATVVLGNFSSPYHTGVLSRQEYTCVRDFLITEIAIISCHRSGVASNMTITEVKSATYKESKHIIKVKNHKTFRTHGPALVCASDELFRRMIIFIDKIRSQIHCDLDNVFVSFYGKKLESGAISKQINSVWKKAGVYSENDPPVRKNVTSNIFRKSSSTIIEDQNPEEAMYVASLLTHAESTSKKYYRLTEKEKFALKGTAALESAFNKRERAEVKKVDDNKIGSVRHIWTSNETEELETIFSEFLEGEKISVNDIREKCDKFHHLVNLSHRQILDKVRSYWRYNLDRGNRNVDSNDTESDTASIIPPSESGCENMMPFNRAKSILCADSDLLSTEVPDIDIDGPESRFNDENYVPPEESSSGTEGEQVTGRSKLLFDAIDVPESECNDQSYVPPEESSSESEGEQLTGKSKLFSETEAKVIIESCSAIFRSGPISISRIQVALAKSTIGKRILQQYDMKQIQTRLKYERLRYRKKKINIH